MSNWTARAKAATAQTGQGGTAKTDETALLCLAATAHHRFTLFDAL